jgi:hypothetical protein
MKKVSTNQFNMKKKKFCLIGSIKKKILQYYIYKSSKNKLRN